MTPKTVLIGTAIAVSVTVSQNACWKPGDWSTVDDRLEAVLERAHEDEPDRQREQQRQVAAGRWSGSSRRGQRRP